MTCVKGFLLTLLLFGYFLLRVAFAVIAFCFVWKVTQHFWPFMNSVLRLVLAVAASALVMQLIGHKFAKAKGADENQAE